MPTYCVTHAKSGETREVYVPFSEFNRRFKNGRIRIGRKTYHLDVGAQQCQANRKRGKWPIWSDAAGVHPDQAQEVMEHARANGVPVEVNSEGQIRFDSLQHQRRYLRLIGMRDLNGFT